MVWVYEPEVGLPIGGLHGKLGRSEAPQPAVDLGIAAADVAGLAPLRQPRAWPIPGAGPARAAVYGFDGDHAAIDLIDVDGGRVVWRDATTCAAPIVATTAEAIVCGDAGGTRAIGLDGQLRWATAAAFVVATGPRIVVDAPGGASVIDAATGDARAYIPLPRGVAAGAIVASCGDDGRELFALGGGRLLRIADAPAGKADRGSQPAIAWSAGIEAAGASDALGGIDACAPTVVVGAATTLLALDRATGQTTGRLDGVLGWWAARDGSDRIEVATALGVERYTRDLSSVEPALDLPPLGALIAARGDRRLVRASELTAVLLDRGGAQGYLPLAEMSAVLGDTALITARWTGSPGETVHRLALPAPLARPLRLLPRRPGVALDAELRDLPPVAPLDVSAAIPQVDTGMHAVVGRAIDATNGAAIYAIAVDRDGERAAVACADLAARAWRWQRVDGCGPGSPLGLAVGRDVVACAASGVLGAVPATVRATSRDGAARWQWSADSVDGVIAGGDAVVVHDADRITVLDARDGDVLGDLASDDGAAVRAAVVVLDPPTTDGARIVAAPRPIGSAGVPDPDEHAEPRPATLVITAEHGRVVARLAAEGLVPVWSVAVAGVVRALTPAGDGVLVALEDGDAYRIDARTVAIAGMPGLGLAWYAGSDLVTGATLGGPIPGIPAPIPPPIAAPAAPARRPAKPPPQQGSRGEIIVPPPMSTPIAPPPPLGDSWQLTVYELTGGFRARNDYALPLPVAPALRGPTGSPIVVTSGATQREVVVIDPRTGDPVRRVRLPDDAVPDLVFGTVVDGSPVAGTLLASPLRVVVF